MIYLDYNATTPIDKEVAREMKPYLYEHFGNPSSTYQPGIKTKNAIERARGQVASLLGCRPLEIVFTSGGTESNNYAIKGTSFKNQKKGNHVITTQIEHPAVLEVCKYLEQHGFKVSYLQVDRSGLVRISDVKKAITPKTILITIIHANNEVGTIQPIRQISKLAKENGIILHTDAAQSVGKIPIDINYLGVDLLSIAGHKLYAPKGIGALFVRKGLILENLIHGAGQEQGKRAGTENVLEIVGLGKACEIAGLDLDKYNSHTKNMRDRLYDGLIKTVKNIKLNGHPEKRLSNTLSLSFPGLDADKFLSEINKYIAISAGAACHSGEVKVSHVLKAMNVPTRWAKGTLRFSTGKMTTKDEVDKSVEIISNNIFRFM